MAPVTSAVAGLAAAALAGAIAVIVAGQVLNREHATRLDWFMADRGIVRWIRIHSPEQEDTAPQILSDHGAAAARVHEIEIGKAA
jgi:hypothetical protein